MEERKAAGGGLTFSVASRIEFVAAGAARVRVAALPRLSRMVPEFRAREDVVA